MTTATVTPVENSPNPALATEARDRIGLVGARVAILSERSSACGRYCVASHWYSTEVLSPW